MKVPLVTLIYFSPTHTTRAVLRGIAQGFGTGVVGEMDLTPPGRMKTSFPNMSDELVVMGAPVYGGRLPAEAVRRLRALRGQNTPAVAVVVYGNREFEDALLELRDIAVAQGFKPVACGAFLGEHSFDSEAMPIATGRPDQRDLAAAGKFGASIRKKMDAAGSLHEISSIDVPGNFPYKVWQPTVGFSPAIDHALCTVCTTCIAVCPMAAISLRDEITNDPRECIHCSACIRICPVKARSWQDPNILRSAQWLSENCGKRKEPETFI
jgi:ferredoxin